MIRFKDYLQALYNGLEGCAEKVYLKDRPQATSDKTNNYLVVDVSSYLSNGEVDDSFDYHTGRVYVWCFQRDRKSSKSVYEIDINKLDELSKKVQEKFPIVDRELNVKIYRPKVMVSASDDNGWHYVLISANLTTYF